MEELKIKTKIRDMIGYGNIALGQFPRAERYALAQEIRNSMQAMFRLSVVVEKKYFKKTTVQDLDIELSVLKHLIHLAADANLYPNKTPCLPKKKYLHWMKMLEEIGRMIGGYQKSIKQ